MYILFDIKENLILKKHLFKNSNDKLRNFLNEFWWSGCAIFCDIALFRYIAMRLAKTICGKKSFDIKFLSKCQKNSLWRGIENFQKVRYWFRLVMNVRDRKQTKRFYDFYWCSFLARHRLINEFTLCRAQNGCLQNSLAE